MKHKDFHCNEHETLNKNHVGVNPTAQPILEKYSVTSSRLDCKSSG